jgi:hypothetical protein
METTIAELAPYMRGWRSYFGFCETPEVLIYLTRWVRLRLRAALWRQWRTPRRRPRSSAGARGSSPPRQQHGGQRTWPLVPRSGQSPLRGTFERPLQIARPSDVDRWVLAQPTRTAVYGPVRTVVWQGSVGDRRPYADLVGFSEKCKPDKDREVPFTTQSGTCRPFACAAASLCLSRSSGAWSSKRLGNAEFRPLRCAV